MKYQIAFWAALIGWIVLLYACAGGREPGKFYDPQGREIPHHIVELLVKVQFEEVAPAQYDTLITYFPPE